MFLHLAEQHRGDKIRLICLEEEDQGQLELEKDQVGVGLGLASGEVQLQVWMRLRWKAGNMWVWMHGAG